MRKFYTNLKSKEDLFIWGGLQVGNGGYKESPRLREPREPEMGGCVHWKLQNT